MATLHEGQAPAQRYAGEDHRVRYGWPLHVIENARDDPAIEPRGAFLEALYTTLGQGGGRS